MLERAFALTTDLYELTMAAAYFDNGVRAEAVFEMFTRRLPPHRSYLITAGLEQVLDYLSSLRFTTAEIDYLRRHPSFKNVSAEFFDYLREFRFTGDVWAMPEGTAAFPLEPMLRVTAPIIEAQVIETFLLATINFQTLIASKAARVVSAARGRGLIEFGTRRAHGTEAGLFAARAAYIAGFAGTSNVEAGHLFGVPTFGTLAHSFVMSFEDEDEAFRAFLRVFPETATVLVDTYDTVAAVKRLSRDFGKSIPSVRLDSGDLCDLSKRAREILDEAGMTDTRIFVSGDLNEHRIAELIERGAPIDSYGVGTELSTSFDAPALSGVYKLVGLVEDGRVQMRIKLSSEKATYPGPKQVWRLVDEDGRYARDVVTLSDEGPPDARGSWRALLEPVMERGGVVGEASSYDLSVEEKRALRLSRLNKARERAAVELKRLPAALLALESEAQYPVAISDRLKEETESLRMKIKRER
jgi:nicotinate phosphoribosyltransferase